MDKLLYDRRETARLAQQRYREANRELCRERNREEQKRRYQRHKDEILMKRHEQRKWQLFFQTFPLVE